MSLFWRGWNRLVLLAALSFLDFDLWRGQIALDQTIVVHLNAFPLTVYWASRGFLTLCLFGCLVYFWHNSTVGQREESTRVLSRG